MKKLITLVLFILYANALLAQGSTVDVKYFFYEARADENICNANLKFEIIYTDDSRHIFLDRALGDDDKKKTFYVENFHHEDSNKKVKQLKLFMETISKEGARCKNRLDIIEEAIYIDMDDNSCKGKRFHFKEQNSGAFEVEHSITFNYKISNRIDIIENQSRTQLGYEDDFTVNATSGFNRASYNWEYQVLNTRLSNPNPSNWKPLARPSTANTLIFKAKNHPDAAIGKYVVFRIKPCYGHPQGKIQRYKILKSAPHIVTTSNPQTTPVTCFGDNDGTVTLQFARALTATESFALEVVDLSDQINSTNPPRYASVKQMQITAANMQDKKLTITGLPGSKSQGFRVQFVGGTNLYADGPNHSIDFNIYEPAYLEFNTPTFTNINCFGGNDGTISLEAEGGTNGNYEYQLENPDGTIDPWQAFNNQYTHTITDLSLGDYNIKIRDANGCTANEISDVNGDGNLDIGDEIVHTVTISEPNAPLALRFDESKDATASGFTNGFIRVLVFGGTPNPDDSYNVLWQNSSGTTLTTVDTQVTPEGYLVTLRDIGAGSYLVSVTDANHTAATQKGSCEIPATAFSISEPPPLIATLEETNPISCNSSNAFNDPFSDGELVVHAEGGVPLGLFDNGGLPYYYTWKKEDASGIFQELVTETDSILSNISVGRYSVNIEDANGIILAEYVNNVLVNPEDIIYDLKEPDLITITFDKGAIACNDGNEGWAQANISGGTGAYTLRWSNGATTDRIENLVKGTYLLFVTDEKGCEATGQVMIEAPDALSVAITQQKNPTCYKGTDAAIALEVTGGVAPYTYQWLKDNEPTSTIVGTGGTNLTAGTYTVTITDVNLCSETIEIVIEDPKPNLIDLGGDRLLCGGQSIVLNATYEGAVSYQWTSDTGITSTSPTIEVSTAGTYSVAITTTLGCMGSDTIAVSVTNTPIDAHFVVSTQVFTNQDIALVNISEPLGDKVEWFFPPEAEVIAETNENAILRFSKLGAYDIILRSNQGDCFLDYMKTIIVDEAENILDIGDADTPFIQEFKVFPNPSNGNFKVDIALSEASEIALKIFSISSRGLVNKRRESAAADFQLEYNLVLASGSYILLLETAKGSEIRKVIIQ